MLLGTNDIVLIRQPTEYDVAIQQYTIQQIVTVSVTNWFVILILLFHTQYCTAWLLLCNSMLYIFCLYCTLQYYRLNAVQHYTTLNILLVTIPVVYIYIDVTLSVICTMYLLYSISHITCNSTTQQYYITLVSIIHIGLALATHQPYTTILIQLLIIYGFYTALTLHINDIRQQSNFLDRKKFDLLQQQQKPTS